MPVPIAGTLWHVLSLEALSYAHTRADADCTINGGLINAFKKP